MYLAVAGNIGAGKSTLTRILAERYRLNPIYEVVDENPYLEDFYRDMRRYAFPSQVFFLARRLEQHLAQVNPGLHIVQDRTIFEDANVFARNLFDEGMMTERDFGSYLRLFEAISKTLRVPDVLVYLHASVETLYTRVQRRGRAFEQDLSPDYLAQLNVLYERWVDEYTLSPVVRVDADKPDFLAATDTTEALFAALSDYGLTLPLL